MKLNFKRKTRNKVKNKGKSRNIKMQLTSIIVSFVVACCLFLALVTSFLNYRTADNILTETMEETTKQVSENISEKIKGIKNAAIQTGCIKEISNPELSVEEKKSIIYNQESLYGLRRGKIISTEGIDYFSEQNYSDREYFKVAMSGNVYMSSPVISKVTGENTFVVAAPIWENGVQGSNVIGVVSFVPDENFLNDIVDSIKISENSYAYLINNEGTTIADTDRSLVGIENTIEESKQDPSLVDYADADKKLISGETGHTHVKEDGSSWILGYTPIENTDGWGVGLMVNRNDFFGELYSSIIITIIIAIAFSIFASIVAMKFANKISKPLEACSERLQKLADGDLNSDVPNVSVNDEIDLVADATGKMVNGFSEMIKTLTDVLTEVSNGNLDIDLNDENLSSLFKNDFEPMLIAINSIVDELNDILSQINVAGEQVSYGSEQLAQGAQVLSQGATEQASSVEELSATISEVALQIKQTAENATKAKQISMEASIATTKGQNQMKEMIEAMNEISTASNEIGNIIKNIDDIAFQTNILALNAAVEAARAGSAGKGFAVVADEVRNLAAKSAESAKTTADLIERSLKAIENGTKIVSETAKSLEDVVDGAKRSGEVIQDIADASAEQAQHINQVNTGVEQISVVVQTNSATAEESAASSEELSSQSYMLKELIGNFKLKKN